MRMEQLAYLCEVAKIGSINASAEKLHISQQSLNASLKALEKELNCPLFSTSRQGIRLTAQGEAVVSAAKDILSRLDTLTQELAQDKNRQNLRGSIALQIAPAPLEYFAANILSSFSAEYPYLTLNLVEADHLQIFYALVTSAADLGVLGFQYKIIDKIFPELANFQNIAFVPLYQFKIFVIASAQSPIAKYKSLSLKTLLKYPLILPTNSALENDLNYRWLKLYGKPQVKFTTSSVNTYKRIVSSGQAVGLFTNARHCNVDIPLEPGLVLIPLNADDNTVTVGYLYNTDNPITPAMQAFIDTLITYCR